MSRMSTAWISENSKGGAIRPSLAALASSLPRMSAMISSITLSALIRPSRMWAAFLGPLEAELGAARDDVDLMVDVAVQRLGEVERARHAVDEGDHVDRER